MDLSIKKTLSLFIYFLKKFQKINNKSYKNKNHFISEELLSKVELFVFLGTKDRSSIGI